MIKNLLHLFKSKWILLIQVIGAFLLPIKPLILLVGFMIVLDTISGLWKANKIHDPFSSRKLSRVIQKMALYESGLIMFYILERYLLGEFVLVFTSIPFLLTKMVATFFCAVEMVSLNENVKAVYGINFFELFKKYLFRVKAIKDDVTDIGTLQ